LPNGGLDQVAAIRAIAQPELGWDDATWAREEAAYRETWRKAYGAPGA
jgi:glycerol-3-phosphate dehydrogenase